MFSKIMTKVFAVYPEAELKRGTAEVIADKRRAEIPAIPPVTMESPEASSSALPGAIPAVAAAPAPEVTAVPESAAEVHKVDVAANLDALAKQSKKDFDWRKSIVDLLKILDLDSSLSARKELADELGYNGDKSDSAAMNVWLHKQVITKLEENGGKVPGSLVA
jgi:hypothetical protein